MFDKHVYCTARGASCCCLQREGFGSGPRLMGSGSEPSAKTDPEPTFKKVADPVPDHIWQIYFFTIVVFFWVCISNEIERKTIRTRPVPVPTSGKPGSWSNPFGTKLILFFKKNRIRLKQPDQDPLKNIRIHQNTRNRICNKTIPGSEYRDPDLQLLFTERERGVLGPWNPYNGIGRNRMVRNHPWLGRLTLVTIFLVRKKIGRQS